MKHEKHVIFHQTFFRIMYVCMFFYYNYYFELKSFNRSCKDLLESFKNIEIEFDAKVQEISE